MSVTLKPSRGGIIPGTIFRRDYPRHNLGVEQADECASLNLVLAARVWLPIVDCSCP